MRRENAEILNGVDTERARSADPNFPALEPELTSQTERKGPGRFEEN
jgi:hypothetical protein